MGGFLFLISTMPVPRPAAEIGNGGNYLKRHALMNYQENEPEKQRSGCDYYADYDSRIEAIRDELESGRQNAENSKPGNNEPVGILPPWIFCPGRNRSAVTPIQLKTVQRNRISQSDLFSVSWCPVLSGNSLSVLPLAMRVLTLTRC